jgi:hypothetical protein
MAVKRKTKDKNMTQQYPEKKGYGQENEDDRTKHCQVI